MAGERVVRGIAATRATPSPDDLDATVHEALRVFDRFIEVWTGAAAHELAFNSVECGLVRDAIVAVGKTAHRDREVGRAVFKVSYAAENRSSLQFECMTPVFEESEQPINALAGYRKRDPAGHYEALAVVEPL
jgi:hypothetical protein